MMPRVLEQVSIHGLDFSQINLDWLMRQIRELWAKIKGIDDHIESYVEGTVEKMIEDGSFDDVIGTYFDDSIKKFSGLADIQTARKFRCIDDVAYQSFTKNGTNYIFCATTADSKVKIVETDGNGVYIRSNVISTIPQCNSITYNPDDGYLYLASPNHGIYIINYSTLEVADSIEDNDYSFCAVTFKDKILYTLAYYVPMSDYRIFKYEGGSFSAVVAMESLESDPFTILYQDMVISDNIAYITLTSPNMLVVTDLATGSSTMYKIGDGSGFFAYGEVEGIEKVGNSIYISSTYGDANITNINQVFKTNILGDLVADSAVFGRYPYPGERSTMYVDSSSTATNPTGYSDAKFSCVTEAVMQWKYLDGKYFVNISVAYDASDPFEDEFITMTGCPVDVNGNGNVFGKVVVENCHGQFYGFSVAAGSQCMFLNFQGRIAAYNDGPNLTIMTFNGTLNNITPTVDASASTVAEGSVISYGTTSNLIRLEAQA